jgi:hypothetical protein
MEEDTSEPVVRLAIVAIALWASVPLPEFRQDDS